MDGLAPPTHSQAASGAGCDLATTATVASGAERLRVQIRGAVQGVGFRPFVYRLATDMALPGWVINDTGGVVVEVEGTHAQLTRFAERLATDKPPRAMVHSVEVAWSASTTSRFDTAMTREPEPAWCCPTS
jgi:acylphosphatase